MNKNLAYIPKAKPVMNCETCMHLHDIDIENVHAVCTVRGIVYMLFDNAVKKNTCSMWELWSVKDE